MDKSAAHNAQHDHATARSGHDLVGRVSAVSGSQAAVELTARHSGGEPMMHPQIDEMVNELVKRKKYVYLCTNAELVRKRWDRFNFTPSPYFSFAIHIDGLRERHDESVAKQGVFDEAIASGGLSGSREDPIATAMQSVRNRVGCQPRPGIPRAAHRSPMKNPKAPISPCATERKRVHL